MATLIKLTKTDGTTKGGYHWDVGTTHSLPAVDNPQLCSRDVFHAYESVEVAAFLRYLHNYAGDVLAWVVEGDVVVKDAAKVGVFSLTVTGQAELPRPTLKQTVLFGLFCASAVLPDGTMDEAIEATRREDYTAAARAATRAADAARAAAAHAADAVRAIDLHAIALRALAE